MGRLRRGELKTSWGGGLSPYPSPLEEASDFYTYGYTDIRKGKTTERSFNRRSDYST